MNIDILDRKYGLHRMEIVPQGYVDLSLSLGCCYLCDRLTHQRRAFDGTMPCTNWELSFSLRLGLLIKLVALGELQYGLRKPFLMYCYCQRRCAYDKCSTCTLAKPGGGEMHYVDLFKSSHTIIDLFTTWKYKHVEFNLKKMSKCWLKILRSRSIWALLTEKLYWIKSEEFTRRKVRLILCNPQGSWS